MAESARLLNGYTPKGYRGFESHPLRHFNAEKPPQTDIACVCVSKCMTLDQKRNYPTGYPIGPEGLDAEDIKVAIASLA